MLNVDRIRTGARAAFLSSAAGAAAVLLLVLFFAVGGPWGTLNDLALLVAVVALQPMMLAHYELGGIVPLSPARLSLLGASLAVAGWAVIQAAFVLGLVDFEYERPATGAMALQAVLLAMIGLWIAGASLLAGPWLPMTVRALGIVSGAGTTVTAIGLLQGGMTSAVALAGAPGYLVGLPLWAFLLGGVFRARARGLAADGEGEVAAPSAAESASP